MANKNARLLPVCIVVLICPLPSTAQQPCAYDWLPVQDVGGTDGTVYATTTWDPDGAGPQPELLVVGGWFSIAGDRSAAGVAAWDGRRWQTLAFDIGYPYAMIRALTVYDGQLIMGGQFYTAAGITYNHIARYDGQQWHPLGTGMNWDVTALTVHDGELIAGGRFTMADGAPCNHIARWDGQQWQPLGAGMDRDVHALTVHDGQLYAGGYFTTAGDVACSYIARWDGQQWLPVGTGTNDYVRVLMDYDGQLVAGGRFTTAGGTACNRVARWDGQQWLPVGMGMNNIVRTLVIHDGELVAGGYFTTADGLTCNHVARWDGQQWQPMGQGIGEANEKVYALTIYAGQLIAGGSFTPRVYPHAGNVARWDGQQWLPIRPEAYGFSGPPPVKALTVYNGQLIAGGAFASVDFIYCSGIAGRDGQQWHALGAGMDGQDRVVSALTVHDGELIAGGGFTSAGGIPSAGVARWDGQQWQPWRQERPWWHEGPWWQEQTGVCGTVSALTVHNGQLIAAGQFITSKHPYLYVSLTGDRDEACVNIARWDGRQWLPIGAGISNHVYALAVYNGQLIAGGSLACTLPEGAPCSSVARWDGQQWRPMGTGLGHEPATVCALAVYDGQLIAGGWFSLVDGDENLCRALATWDGQEWQPMGTGMRDDTGDGPYVAALTVYHGQLIAGGAFTTAGDADCHNIARWDGQQWLPLEAGINGPVDALAVYDGDLVVGGSFTMAGERFANSWARWGPVEPTATVTAWRSVRTHAGGAGESAISLDAMVTTGSPIARETRYGGIRQIEADLIGPADGTLTLQDTVWAEQAGDATIAYPADQQQLVWHGGDSYTLVAEWTDGLPDAACYRINLLGCVPCLGGDSDCLVRALAGDINDDGKTDLTDMSLAQAMNGTPLTTDTIRYDVNSDGLINLLDKALIRNLNGAQATCP